MLCDYEYTRPRAPVAAAYTGPGPCYRLPGLLGTAGHDPRSVHTRAPSYHFGLRFADRSGGGRDGPGPCYMPSPHVYRDGKEVAPHCVIVNTRAEPKVLVTPGPAAYAPRVDAVSYYAKPPAFSIAKARSRSRRSRDTTPGETRAAGLDGKKSKSIKAGYMYF